MQFHKIEVDERVWKYLKRKAEPFEDTPNSVLNRILFSERKPNLHRKNNEISKTNPSPFPNGIPKALAQILEVLYEIKVSGRNRNEATNLIRSACADASLVAMISLGRIWSNGY